jgi:phosphatidylserine/phosphatidylglycerophosphate/cardiolipin synthase-like enzyme
MSMQSFDITSLLRFKPPKYLCEKCYALLLDAPYNWRTKSARCPVCGVEYHPGEKIAFFPVHIRAYLKNKHLEIQFNDLIEHSQRLASIADDARHFLAQFGEDGILYPPIRALFEVLLNAKKFVHFTTYGISHMFLGALKMAAQRVDVRGIVSNVEGSMLQELTEYGDEAPKLNIKIFKRSGRPESWDTTPHQKIIVVDGLIAFKGSANLTISGWRKAAQRRDVIEVVTDIKEIVDIHNRFFSPIWAEFSDVQEITMETLPF